MMTPGTPSQKNLGILLQLKGENMANIPVTQRFRNYLFFVSFLRHDFSFDMDWIKSFENATKHNPQCHESECENILKIINRRRHIQFNSIVCLLLSKGKTFAVSHERELFRRDSYQLHAV